MSGGIAKPGNKLIQVKQRRGQIYRPGASQIGGGSLGGTGPALVPWTPLNLGAALVAWWDAQASSTLNLSGSNVTSWTDKVAAVVATQAGVAPTFSATARNGKPGLSFNGTTQRMTFTPTGFPSGSAAVTAAVAAFGNGSQFAFIFGSNPGGSQTMFGVAAGPNVSFYDGVNSLPSIENWTSVDRFAVIGLSGSAGTLNVDGNAQETFTDAGVGIGTTTGVIGAFINQAGLWTGVIQQIVVMNRTLTSTEQDKLAGWESWYDGKAGSNLPVGHPYKSAAPHL